MQMERCTLFRIIKIKFINIDNECIDIKSTYYK